MQSSSGKQNVFLVANRGFALLNSRLQLIRSLQQSGFNVIAIGDMDDEEIVAALREYCEVQPLKVNRGGLSLLSDWLTFFTLLRLAVRYKPVLVHNFNAKPVLLGTFAARVARWRKVIVVNTITGLGFAFISGGPSRAIASAGYRLLLRLGNHTIFQNEDDRSMFIEQGWVKPDNSSLVTSSGVDTRRFSPPDKGQPGNVNASDPVNIVMIGRLIGDKGVSEYLAAAAIIRDRGYNARFSLVGEFDLVHPNAISRETIDAAVASGHIEYLGFRPDIEKVLAGVDLLVLPSYREGVPRVILEAAACGLPSIGFDVPGVRAAIEHDVTGLLVAPIDSEALATAIASLLDDPDRRRQMGQAALERVRDKFDIHAVTQQQMAVYAGCGVGLA